MEKTMEQVMAEVAEGEMLLARVREDQARDRAAARVMLRDDVTHVEVREDGTMWCTDYRGRQVLRPAGWRGRS